MEMTFGERLLYLRKEKGLTQIELAKEFGVGKLVISLWEKDSCELTLTKLILIAKFF